jgi:hypothetical protein
MMLAWLQVLLEHDPSQLVRLGCGDKSGIAEQRREHVAGCGMRCKVPPDVGVGLGPCEGTAGPLGG